MGVFDAYLSAAAYDLFVFKAAQTANSNWEKLTYKKLHFDFFPTAF